MCTEGQGVGLRWQRSGGVRAEWQVTMGRGLHGFGLRNDTH